MAKKKILILASLPNNHSYLDLKTEINKITTAYAKFNQLENTIKEKGNNVFEITTISNVSLKTMSEAIQTEKPSIVHFCGHGMENGCLIFESDNGTAEPVKPEGLAAFFKQHTSHVQCVLLNACYSAKTAHLMCQHINYVIGMNQEILDESAIKFAEGFYEYIANSHINNQNAIQQYSEIAKAFELGKARIQAKAESNFQEKIPVLEIKLAEKKKKLVSILPKARYTLDLSPPKEGSLAIVFKANDNILKRDVAIKVFYEENLQQPFDKGIQEAVKISDRSNFITIYDVNLNKIPYYYVMQYVEGKTLREKINTRDKLRFNDALNIIVAIGDALLSISSSNSIFPNTTPNIKPSNIILNEKNEPFISPFNLFESLHQNEIIQELKKMSDKQNESDSLEASAYQLPERFSHHNPNHPTFDQSAQYLLGILAYEILTGKTPRVLEDYHKLEQEGDSAFRDLRSLEEIRSCRNDCPEILQNTIYRMTEHEPKKRYATLEDALKIIRNVNFYLNTVKESYIRCLNKKDSDKSFIQIFYDKFIEKEDVKAQFIGFNERELNNQDKRWHIQYQQLEEAIILLFAYYEQKQNLPEQNEQEEPNILSRIANSHSKIPHEFYSTFVSNLIETVKNTDPECTKESEKNENSSYTKLVTEAWEEVLRPGIEYMQKYQGKK
ncbi:MULTISPECIES: protein kinase domain-containing protein [Nostocales]|uniref:Protein kinase n=3 Tax=Nostocales TaxID=1161 RepID=A0A8S9T190_9CYAN|nr:protein kinase [Tolypothrix bouteillei]KAF3885332.1 protein kinase [Tolypothrix bouteillei VB521301]